VNARATRRVLAAVLAALALLLLLPTVARAQQQTPDWAQGERVVHLVEDVGAFRLVEASDTAFVLELIDAKNRIGGNRAGIMRLLRSYEYEDRPHRYRTRSFSIEIENYRSDLAVTEVLVRAARQIGERDDGSWATHARWIRRQAPWWQFGSAPPWLVEATLAVVIAAAVIAWWRRPTVTWEVRLPHLLPAAIQVLLYAYWSLYWPDVGQHVPSLLLQLAIGFAADAAFSILRFGSWRVGASPLPIVLSANLFAWFDTPGILIVLAVAFASKTYVRRDGRHLLNPSAAGLTAGGLCAAFAPQTIHFGGVFHTMNLAPNLAELVTVLALLPQLRFRIVSVSIGALMAMWMYSNVPIHRPAVLLAIVLLATDPATLPRKEAGKLLFGAFVGLGIGLTSLALRLAGVPDDFSKVMPIPLANALAPQFDRLGAAVSAFLLRRVESSPVLSAIASRIGTWGAPSSAGAPRAWSMPNAAMIACWIVMTLPGFREDKRAAFEPALVWTWGTPLVVRDADDVPRCSANPVFCEPFSFYAELKLWRTSSRRSE
jgi:hypothetical protein